MHVDQQVLNLLFRKRLPEAGHLASSKANDLAHSLIVGGQSAEREIGLTEHTLEGRSLLAAGGIRCMAAIAVVVVQLPAGDLLGIEPEFGVTLAPFSVAAHKNCQYQN
jgi:hypothetical protein